MKNHYSQGKGQLLLAYQKLRNSFLNSIKSGAFYRWSKTKQQYVIARLMQLIQQLRQVGVRVALSSGLLLGTLGLTAQGLEIDECAINPFDAIEASIPDDALAFPRVLDFDGDGDDDLLLTTSGADFSLQYYENTGSGLILQEGDDNPFGSLEMEIDNSIAILYFTTLMAYGDIDCDGDLDLVLGEKDQDNGEVLYLEMGPNGIETGEDGELTEDDFQVLEVPGLADDDKMGFVRFGNVDDDCEDEMILYGDKDGDNGCVIVLDQTDGAYVKNDALGEKMDVNILPWQFIDLTGDGLDELIGFDNEDGGLAIIQQQVGGEYQSITDEMDPLFELAEVIDDFDIASLAFALSFGDLDGDGMLNFYIGNKDSDEVPLCGMTNIPVAEPCVKAPIPTMGQWGLMILGLILSSIAVGFLWKKKKNTAYSED